MTDTATNREGPYPGCVQRYNVSLSTQGSGDHKCTKALSFFQSSTRKLLGDLWGEVEKQLGVIRCRGNTGQAQRDRSPFLSTLKAQPQRMWLPGHSVGHNRCVCHSKDVRREQIE